MLTGATIRRYRELRRLSQAELAKRLGISRQAVNGGETGAVQRPRWFPHAAELLRIPDATCMDEDEILTAISELTDHLLLARQGRPSTDAAGAAGRETLRSA